MIVDDMLRRLGNQQAIDNARVASAELSKRRVERESVEIYLERLRGRSGQPRGEHDQHRALAAR